MANNITTCTRHPERIIAPHACASAQRDGIPDQICCCCEECVAVCLRTPHGHGGTPEVEWNYETGQCVICGEDIRRWMT